MHSLWNFFLHKRQFTWLLIAALLVAGAYSVIIIPKESAPEVIVPVGIITSALPGASASDVEQLITNKIEKAVKNADGVNKVTSNSRSGISVVSVEFNAKANVDTSITNLKNAVDTVRSDLPTEATTPVVTKVNFADQPILVISVSADVLPSQFTAFSDSIKREIEGVGGVSKVTVSGVRKREVQVVVNPEALQTYHLSLGQVMGGLAAANATLPIGTITTGGVEYSLQFDGDIKDPDVVGNIAVANVGGKPVLVRDIATVSTGVQKVSTVSRVAVDGGVAENAATFNVFKRSGGDVTSIAGAVKGHLAALQKPGLLLERSKVLVSVDNGKKVQDDLTNLIEAGMETIVLVVISLLLTIGWRESFVAALSIPLSFVIAFVGLLVSGNTINFVSLFALILAVGILVDSGIVVTEAIHTRMRKKGEAIAAAEAAIAEYSWPLIGGTMTTIAVFAPLFFLSGVTGEFISSIPFTIIFVLAASIFVALGLVPMLAIYVVKPTSANRLEEIQEEWTHVAQEWYRIRLHNFLANKKWQRNFIAALIVGLIISFSLPVVGLVKTVFFPGENVNYVYLELETKRGTPLAETDLSLRATEEILYGKKYVKSFTTTAGAGSAFTGENNTGGTFGNITVELIPKENRTLTSADIVKDLRADLAMIKSADVRIIEQSNGPPSGAPVVIKFFGDDLGELGKVAEHAQNLLKTIPGTTDVSATTKNLGTEFVFTIDTAKATALGLTSRDVAQTLRTAVYGTAATTIRSSGDDIDVVVKLALDPRFTDPTETTNVSLDALKNITVNTPNGTVLLGSVITSTIAPANTDIVHEKTRRLESVSAYTAPGVTPAEIVAKFKARVSEINKPEGVDISYGGETEDINKSFTEMFFALIAGLVLMLTILVLSFNSIRYSFYLLSVVPLSLIGVLDGLALTGQPVSFTSLLGVVALAGVIVNHNIILMDSMLHFRKEMTSTDPEDLISVVTAAGVSRLRPIFLTTVTTVIGMWPLSRISDFWSPLAYAIMFGLAFAMILTLILVPTLFYRREKMLLEGRHGIFYRFFSFLWSFALRVTPKA